MKIPYEKDLQLYKDMKNSVDQKNLKISVKAFLNILAIRLNIKKVDL